MSMRPFLNVLYDKNSEEYDATFIGLDFCSTEDLKGVEKAADSIRRLSYRYSNADNTSIPLKIYNPERGYILKNVKINDYGNIDLLSRELEISIGNFPVFVGGDHAATYYIVKRLNRKYKNITILQIDAHGDYIDEFEEYPHGSVMCEISKMENIKKIIHCGLRGNLNTGPGLEKSLNRGNVLFTNKTLSFKAIEKELDKNALIYITIDTDFFDPSIAPATNHPEPNGWLYEDTRIFLERIFQKYNIIGLDVVEYNPNLDYSNITGLLLVNLIMECISQKCNGDKNERI